MTISRITAIVELGILMAAPVVAVPLTDQEIADIKIADDRLSVAPNLTAKGYKFEPYLNQCKKTYEGFVKEKVEQRSTTVYS